MLMRYHGAVLMGHDAEEAMRAAIALEDVCENIYRIRNVMKYVQHLNIAEKR